MYRKRFLLSFAPIAILTSTGCGFDVFYALHAVGGQANILFGAVPITSAIANPATSDEVRGDLEYITGLRMFADQQLHLVVDTSFTTFYDGHGRPVSFSVSAAKRDALEPYQWEFPFFGTITFLNYFDELNADAKVAELRWLGYDAFKYELDAYSLAILPNPVLSPMLRRDEIDLATLVFHELTHRTIGRANDGTDLPSRFNESVATYVGRRAALQYFETRDGSGSANAKEAAGRYEDDDLVTAFMQDLASQLDNVYQSDMTTDEKLARKAELFAEARTTFSTQISPMLNTPFRFGRLNEMPDNNAFVLLYQRYNERQPLFDNVFEANGEDWTATLPIYQQAAAAHGDPFAYLENWLAGH